ncbi:MULTISPECIES: FmdB family zinc ribbon protein [Brevibacillus]|uniref:Zinc ribbon domain-containing protein n=1 Tax=Brevibacillus brevis TaxID=1393 RepID=A0A2Z4MLL4_BREBE|nr:MULTISPECIES: zinc ribbon domain-containing protein [Brevibacillus]AWX57271.1 zinc ribbon domain-containing protein [Brevibacillus brevis]NRR21107.1 zinc ribbon domain-containing protein [Brevibacillus sp. MS2.2]
MPRYDYMCEECGPFVQWLKISELTDSVACPDCQQLSKRMFSAPGLIMTPQALRQRIERGVEPKVVRKHSHSHEGAGCSHNHGSQAQRGHTHSRGGKRPWMVGH